MFISFHKWIIRNIDYLDFQENSDYIIYLIFEVNSENRRGKPSSDYFYTSWIKFYISYGFEENTDYIVFTFFGENLNSLGGRPSKEYFLTIDAARELYEFLGIKEAFTDWFKRMVEYGFENITDYIIYAENSVNSDNRRGRPSVDYFITIEMAKEISMLQRSDY